MGYIFALLTIAVIIVQWALILRLVFDWVQMFARYWRPKGAALVVASGVYSVTDPPIKFLRSKIPPLNLGGISLDLGFIILFLAVWILITILKQLTVAFS